MQTTFSRSIFGLENLWKRRNTRNQGIDGNSKAKKEVIEKNEEFVAKRISRNFFPRKKKRRCSIIDDFIRSQKKKELLLLLLL